MVKDDKTSAQRASEALCTCNHVRGQHDDGDGMCATTGCYCVAFIALRSNEAETPEDAKQLDALKRMVGTNDDGKEYILMRCQLRAQHEAVKWALEKISEKRTDKAVAAVTNGTRVRDLTEGLRALIKAARAVYVVHLASAGRFNEAIETAEALIDPEVHGEPECDGCGEPVALGCTAPCSDSPEASKEG